MEEGALTRSYITMKSFVFVGHLISWVGQSQSDLISQQNLYSLK